MGVLSKNRKHKFNKSGAPNPNNNKVKDAEMVVEDINENDVIMAKAKKAKKNKISAVPIESINGNDTSDVKAKKNKNKIVEMPTEEENVVEAKPKKMKFVEMSNEASESDLGKPKAKKSKNKIVEMLTEEENVVEAKPKKMKFVEMSNEASESDLGKPKAKKSKKNKVSDSPSNELSENKQDNATVAKKVKKHEVVETSGDADNIGITEEMIARYPILKDEEMIKKFQSVNLSNNQKGRLRLHLRQQLRGTSESMLPDAINTKMQAILKTENPNLIKLRVLFNMLKTALQGTKTLVKKEKPVKKEKKQKPKKENGKEDENGTEDKKPEQKVKGPKRYVVFIGNLPLDISKEKILEHFSDLSDKIKDVRIPKPLENRKSRIAYLEVADELTYELSLSKHHSMLDNRRINVLYSTQQNSKITKAEAKGKAAKLVAMQKSGKLAGSEPLSKKRSARRKKMKQAQKKAQEAAERGV